MSMCRLCYKRVEEGRELFWRQSKNKPGGYQTDLFIALQIKLEHNEGWPTKACRKCLDSIRETKSFRTRVEATQLMLAQLFATPKVHIKNDDTLSQSLPVPQKEEVNIPEESFDEVPNDSHLKEELPPEEEPSLLDEPMEEEFIEAEEPIDEAEESIGEKKPVIKKGPQIEPELDDTAAANDEFTSGSECSDDSDVYIPEREDIILKQVPKATRGLRGRPRKTRSATKAQFDSDDDVPLERRKKKKKHSKKNLPLLDDNEAKRFRQIARLNLKYPNRDALEQHMRNSNVLNCDICQASKDSFIDMMWHFMDEHNIRTYQAYVMCCGRKYDLNRVYEHAMYHLDDTAFACLFCERKCKAQIDLTKHISRCHDPEERLKYVCPKCGKNLHELSKYKTHMEWHANMKFHCSLGDCDQSFMTNQQLEDHITFDHNKVSRHICDMCAMGFAKEAQLKSHIKRHFKPDRKWEKCNECNLYFGNIKFHMNKIHKLGGWGREKCKICDKEFSLKYMKRHLAFVHEQGSLKELQKLPCTICGRVFKTSMQHKAHMDIHQGIRYDCHFCSETYGATSNRSKHMIRKHAVEYEAYKAEESRLKALKKNARFGFAEEEEEGGSQNQETATAVESLDNLVQEGNECVLGGEVL